MNYCDFEKECPYCLCKDKWVEGATHSAPLESKRGVWVKWKDIVTYRCANEIEDTEGNKIFCGCEYEIIYERENDYIDHDDIVSTD